MANQAAKRISLEEPYSYVLQNAVKLTALVALATSWLSVGLFFNPVDLGPLTTWLPAVGVVILASLLAIYLHGRRSRLAAKVLVASFLLADAILLRAFRDGQYLYAAALIIILSNYLVGRYVAGAVTVATLVLAALAWGDGIPLPQLVGPVSLALLTMAVEWLSSLHLHMTLSWAWENYRLSLERVDEARTHRAQLASTAKSLEEAYRRLDRANEALAAAWQVAEEGKRFKAQFAANISHELRTPLYLIIGFAETMLFAPESYGTELPAAYRSDLMEIYKSSQHLVSLIDDVLDLSQIEAGRMGLVKEPTDVAEIIREAANLLQPVIERKGLYLHLHLDGSLPTLRLDRTRMRQVLLNLLNNAARYTDRGGIAVSARVDGQQVLVSVADTGPGIAPQQLERIFQSFYQVEASTSRRHGGVGLGLALSRYFVEMHGGRIWVESQPDVGSCFSFSLPLSTAAHEKDYSRILLHRRAPPPAATPTQVLLLHPDPTTVTVLQRHLDEHQVVSAADAASVSQLGIARPKAIITAPGDLAGALRLTASDGPLGAPPGIPVITCPLPGGPLPALALGVRDYLIKPVSRKKLLATLAECAPAGGRVLVVDDDPRVVRLLARMLLSAPRYQVIRAFDGQEALGLMRSDRPDAVLLDLYMPQLDGFSVLDHMAHDPALAQVPVIVVSAKGLPEDGVLRLHGPITVQQSDGFTLAELFRYLQALLDAPRTSPAVDPASDPASAGGSPA